MTSRQVFVAGVGLYAPGLNGWEHARTILAAPQTFSEAPLQLPLIDALPAAERRRLGVAVKLAMATGFDAVRQSPVALPLLATAFSSSAGDGENCHQILEALALPNCSMSPTRFHNSVHNAAAGYWHIATHCRQPSTSLSAHDAGFGAVLLETVSQILSTTLPCLLVAFDTPYRNPLHEVRSVSHPFGVAMLLTPQRSTQTLCSLAISLTAEPAHTIANSDLEAMRCNVPAARSLPLLSALATQQQQQLQQQLVIEYMQGLNISITVQRSESP